MEEKIVYFEKPGKENTADVIRLVLEKAKIRNIKKIVLASTRGYTAKSFLDAVKGKDMNLVVVPWQFSFKKEEGNPFLYATDTPTALANILRVLGQGMKVCVEITMMACDGGCIKMGEKVLVVAGTGSGADFAVVATAASSAHVKSLKINEIICKPI